MTFKDWANGYDAGNKMMMKALQTAADLERKRIIKMLEEQVCLTYKALPKACMDKGCHQTVKLIALIKGEK